MRPDQPIPGGPLKTEQPIRVRQGVAQVTCPRRRDRQRAAGCRLAGTVQTQVQFHLARRPAAAARAAFNTSTPASSCAEPMCSISREPRRDEYTICTARAPDAVFAVRSMFGWAGRDGHLRARSCKAYGRDSNTEVGRVLDYPCEVGGLPSRGHGRSGSDRLSLIRLGSNAIVRLPKGVVARVDLDDRADIGRSDEVRCGDQIPTAPLPLLATARLRCGRPAIDRLSRARSAH